MQFKLLAFCRTAWATCAEATSAEGGDTGWLIVPVWCWSEALAAGSPPLGNSLLLWEGDAGLHCCCWSKHGSAGNADAGSGFSASIKPNCFFCAAICPKPLGCMCRKQKSVTDRGCCLAHVIMVDCQTTFVIHGHHSKSDHTNMSAADMLLSRYPACMTTDHFNVILMDEIAERFKSIQARLAI